MTARTDLEAVLDDTLPPAVAELPDDVLARLVDQVRTAKARQHREMEESVRTAIAGVPFAVRGIVKKALT